jgi:hypothetical protein
MLNMPRVYEAGGFKVYIYLPPAEHGPPHVHVVKAGSEVVIHIGTGTALVPHRVFGPISDREIVRAVRLVESIEKNLLEQWSTYHGR